MIQIHDHFAIEIGSRNSHSTGAVRTRCRGPITGQEQLRRWRFIGDVRVVGFGHGLSAGNALVSSVDGKTKVTHRLVAVRIGGDNLVTNTQRVINAQIGKIFLRGIKGQTQVVATQRL